MSGPNFNDTVDQAGKALVAINNQTSSYALVLSDAGKMIDMEVGAPGTVTVPKDGTYNFPVGTVIAIRQKDASAYTLTPEDGTVTLQNKDGLKTSGQFAIASIMKVAANTWSCFGALTV